MPVAVITGASSGLGREYVEAIIEQYPIIDEFWLIARRKENLLDIAKRHPDKTIAVISLDLQKSESFELLFRLLREKDPEIKVLVNAAGYGQCALFFTSNRTKQSGMISLNCMALTEMTRLCLPYMMDESLVVNISSIAAFVPLSRMAVYSATKSYVLNLSKALRDELSPRGINVIAVCPGAMDTEFFDIAYIPEGSSKFLDSLPRIPAKEIARRSLKKGKRRHAFYTYGSFYKFYHVISKIIPHNWLIRLIDV